MFDLNEFIENWKLEYACYETERLENAALDLEKRLYIEGIFDICQRAIDEVCKGPDPVLTRKRYRFILQKRFRESFALEEVGLALKISPERARQLERALIALIRSYIRRNWPEEMERHA